MIELVSGTSRGIRLKCDALRALNESRCKQFSLPLPSLAQLALPLVGRVAAGSPILAQEHVDQTYYVESEHVPAPARLPAQGARHDMRDAGIMDGDLLAVQNAARRRTARSSSRASATRSLSSASSAQAPGSSCIAENPEFPTIVVEPGRAFEIEGLAVGLIRNNMLM